MLKQEHTIHLHLYRLLGLKSEGEGDSVTTKGQNRFIMLSMSSRIINYVKDRAGGLLMPLRSEWSECTLMSLTSEQGELRELTSEQDEQYYLL